MHESNRAGVHDIVVIGASAGGVAALKRLLSQFSAELKAAVFVVIHLHPGSPSFMDEILGKVSPLRVVAVKEGDAIASGTVYVPVPDRHTIVKAKTVHLSRGPKENLSRPAIDVLFRTAAESHSTRVIGVLLTGMLDDGTAGLQAIKRCGGLSVVQDPADAEHPSMPLNAVQFTDPDYVTSLDAMAGLLTDLSQREAGPPVDIPAGVLLENRIAEGKLKESEIMGNWGDPTLFTCPECGGPIVKEKGSEEGLGRYRCIVGHGFTTRSLAFGQEEFLDRMLWQAAVGLEQRALILDALAREERASGDEEAANRLEQQSKRTRAQVEYAKRAITNGPEPGQA